MSKTDSVSDDKKGASALEKGLQFLLAQEKDGLWPYEFGKDSALEPSCWAVIALHDKAASVESYVKRLATLQNADGGWSNELARLESDWSTAASLFALRYLESKSLLENKSDATQKSKLSSVISKAEDWILDNRTEYYSSAAKFALLLWKGPEHDYERGWPWTQNTFDWVEPTSYVLMAFKNSQRMKVPSTSKAMHLGEQYLLSLVCRDGGWNFGDRNPYGAQNPPDVQSTALALLALKNRQNETGVKRSLEWLRKKMEDPQSQTQRAWGAMVLCSYGQPCDDLMKELESEQNSDGSFSKNMLTNAVACIALKLRSDPTLFA